MVLPNVALRRLGHGANAFRPTTRLVVGDIHQRTRFPMSLGYYLCCLSWGDSEEAVAIYRDLGFIVEDDTVEYLQQAIADP